MLLNEVAREVGMTKRAVKFYEERGLISVQKDENGYRNYSDENIETLKKISIYRKVGICIEDIKALLEDDRQDILLRVYKEKLLEKELKDSELNALRQFIEDGNVDNANEQIDYQTVSEAIESLLPGDWGKYLKSHFLPFLKIRIGTQEQKEALQNILDFCDETKVKLSIIIKMGSKFMGGFLNESRSAEDMIARYRDMTESEYENLKEQVKQGVKLKSGIMKYHPVYVAQRKMQKELQNKGYNEIFIRNMEILSPQYGEYKKAMDMVNDRIQRELGLHYDSNYNLVQNK